MTQVNNNIKVLFKKISDNVKYDTMGSEFYLYDNSDLFPQEETLAKGLLYDYFYTGIAFKDLGKGIKLNIVDMAYQPVRFLLHKDYIYVIKSLNNITIPVGVVSFTPTTEHWVGNSFYAHYIELKEKL